MNDSGERAWKDLFQVTLFLIPLLVLLAYVLLTNDTAIDDALITARYARNLAGGHGLVFAPGENVLGTTTPGWAFLSVWVFWLPLASHAQIQVVQVFATLLEYAGFLTIATSPVFSTVRQRIVFLFCLACVPTLSLAPSMGMETGALIFATALLWRSLSFHFDSRIARFARAGLIIAILLLRLDGIFAIAAIYAGNLIFNYSRAGWKRELVLAALSVGVFLSLFFASTLLFYGQLVPQSMIAKSGLSYEDELLRLELPLSRLQALLDLNFPWPRVIQPILPGLWYILIWVVALVIGFKFARGNRAVRALFLAGILFTAVYATFLTIGQAGVYPWYAHLPVFLLASPILASLILEFNRWQPRLILCLLLLGFLAIHSILFRGVLTQGSVANTVTRQIGEYLRGRTSQSIMLEPIGYIGFYSNTPKVYDLGGLVSPEVLALRQSGRDGWFAEAVKMFRPEFVVLRRNEIENNLGWNVGTLFGSPEQRDWWEAHYLAEVNIGKGTSPLANFTIYRRRD